MVKEEHEHVEEKEKCPKCGKESWMICCTDFYDAGKDTKERVIECLNCEAKFIERWVFEGTYEYQVGRKVPVTYG